MERINRPKARLSADIGALARVMKEAQPQSARVVAEEDGRVQRRRQMVADFCRLVGAQLGRPSAAAQPTALVDRLAGEPGLSPRMRQTLACLLAGDAEKQVAPKLGVSPHTVHVYVKALYKHFGVSSRGELLARFIRA